MAASPKPGGAPAADDPQGSLYAKHQKIYPRQAHGLFTRLKATSDLVLLGIFYFLPWIQWNGRQAILFDLPERKFYIFGFTFWPQDFIYLALLLMIAGLALFFFTTLAGRLWCGFACPQTVWTDAFLWFERLIEGDRSQQIKLDKAPMSWRKFRVKATKHSAWIVFSLFTGFMFVAYFTPARDLFSNLVSFNLGGWETFWLLFYGFATYGNAGWMREQVCLYMCPYARFQSAMFDKDTLIVAYDASRGEPRGSRKRGEDPKSKGLGSCVNCTLCVQVCPTGIDIRDGLQYQCISCSACIDVCNEVMDKMNYPRGLVRYTTEHNLKGNKTHILRPRIVLYGVALLALFIGLIYAIVVRTPLILDISRDRQGQLYQETNEGMLRNVYHLRVLNMDDVAHTYQLTGSGIEGMQITQIEGSINVPAGEARDFPIHVVADPAKLQKRSTKIEFVLQAEDKPDIQVSDESRFIGPVSY